MIVIRPAKKRDWPAIKALVLADPDLQHDDLPHWSEFVVLVIVRENRGCCELKVYGKKLSEVRSFAFKDEESRRLFAEVLVKLCVDRAIALKVYQVLVTIGNKAEQKLFRKLGFRRLVGQKHMMLMSIAWLEPFGLKDIPGVMFVRARTDSHWQGIIRLARRYKKTLIQPESKLFPSNRSFRVAIADGKVVGCSALSRFSRRKGEHSNAAEIRAVVVNPHRKYRGRGIGQELVKRCVNWAISLELEELFTVTGKRDWFEKKIGFGTRRGSQEAWFVTLKQNGGQEKYL